MGLCQIRGPTWARKPRGPTERRELRLRRAIKAPLCGDANGGSAVADKYKTYNMAKAKADVQRIYDELKR